MLSTLSPRWSPLPAGLGDMIRTARQQAGLSRDTLAAVTQTSKGCVQGLEEGLRPPSTDVAERLCTVLSLDPWRSAVLLSVAVDPDRLRTRRGVRHVNRRGAAA